MEKDDYIERHPEKVRQASRSIDVLRKIHLQQHLTTTEKKASERHGFIEVVRDEKNIFMGFRPTSKAKMFIQTAQRNKLF